MNKEINHGPNGEMGDVDSALSYLDTAIEHFREPPRRCSNVPASVACRQAVHDKRTN